MHDEVKWIARVTFLIALGTAPLQAAVVSQDWGKLPDGRTAHLYTVSSPNAEAGANPELDDGAYFWSEKVDSY